MLITARGKFCWREYFVTPPTVTLNGVEQRGRAQTKRDRRMMKRAEIAQRQQICGE